MNRTEIQIHDAIFYVGYEDGNCIDIHNKDGRYVENLSDAIASKIPRNNKDHFGRLRIVVEQLDGPPPDEPPRPPRAKVGGLVPKCNCVHIHSPHKHLAYCAVWGGKKPLEEYT